MIRYDIGKHGRVIEYEDRPESDKDYWNAVWTRDGHWVEYHVTIPYPDMGVAAAWLKERHLVIARTSSGNRPGTVCFIFMPWHREIAMEFKLTWG